MDSKDEIKRRTSLQFKEAADANGTALYPAWGYVEELIVAMVRHRSFVDGRV